MTDGLRPATARSAGIGPARWGAATALLSGALLAGGGCINEGLTSSRSSSLLVIERIGAARGGTNDEPTTTLLQSDVETEQSVFDDIGRVTTRLALKDPGSTENPTAPSTSNYVTIERYRVEYRRTDGRNEPGLDVPFPFEGAVTFTTVSGIQTADFVLVRASAKLESPLHALVGGGGAVVINTIAEVTFYGQDQTGAAVSGVGTIGIHFADWADDTTAETGQTESANAAPGRGGAAE